MHCAVKTSAVPKVTQSRNFNRTNVRNFQHTVDLTAQLLSVQLELKVKLYVCGPLRRRSAEIVGSNDTGVTDVLLLTMCVIR